MPPLIPDPLERPAIEPEMKNHKQMALECASVKVA